MCPINKQTCHVVIVQSRRIKKMRINSLFFLV